ncbi:hypothetical protein Ahy_A10g048177 [Arachis hypogaea]|uniref:Transposase MuDR plant domain-containing protein n=1 Tax=Arachis hypogaea TaxID=3818 RepID=A0A445B4M8_ARAHY|nr:hypothetical protein Ahy_A10g048177 [Arachis hypogaea]
MSNFVIPMFHHGGRLGKDSNGVLKYLDGKDSSSSSSSDEDDESSEDEAYNPPSDAYDESSDTDSDEDRIKLRTHTNKKAADEKDDCDNGKGGNDGKAARNVNTDKKRTNSRMKGKERNMIGQTLVLVEGVMLDLVQDSNIGLPCKHAVATIFRLKNMGYKLEDFVDKSLTMDAVRAAYSYVIQPVNSEEYWIPTDCQGILPPPIAKEKKNKKKVPKLKASPNVDFGEEIDLSQSAPPNDGPATQQIPEPPVGFRMKQIIVRPPIPPTQNHLEPLGQATSGASGSLFTFMPTPDFRPPTNT